MADTYLLKGVGITCTGANQSLIHIFNAAGSSKVVSIYRVWAENPQITSVTAASNALTLQRITAAVSSNINLEPIAYDVNSPAAIPTVAISTTTTSVNAAIADGRLASNVLTAGQVISFGGMNATPTVTVATAPATAAFTMSAANTATNTVIAQLGYISAGSKATVTVDTAGIFKKILWTQGLPAQVGGTINDFQNRFMWGNLFDAGYYEANIEPIILRAGNGISVQNIGLTVGMVDLFIELTIV